MFNIFISETLCIFADNYCQTFIGALFELKKVLNSQKKKKKAAGIWKVMQTPISNDLQNPIL